LTVDLLNLIILTINLSLRQTYVVSDISHGHTPTKEAVEYPHAVLSLHNPNIFQIIVLSHVPNVILNKVVDVLAEKVHTALPHNCLVVLDVYYKLKE
jgi:hypothetical protein